MELIRISFGAKGKICEEKSYKKISKTHKSILICNTNFVYSLLENIYVKICQTLGVRVVQDADPRSKSVRIRGTRTRADAQIRDEPGTRTRKKFCASQFFV